ncbi:MAG: hydantoinase/oxoprolinase family protein, partial [Alphaproteobacteria bacterium]|nr:hydantoinase/oxoprolinase family protein [Alphaproteobacteria bacterium]
DGDGVALKQAFDQAYEELFGRVIPSMEVEILTWALSISTVQPNPSALEDVAAKTTPAASGERNLFDADRTDFVTAPVYQRDDLTPGMTLAGPALIAEAQTTTAVTAHFQATVNGAGHIELQRMRGETA